MSVAFDVPADIEPGLHSQAPDLSAEAREAYGVKLFRQRRLSHAQ